MILQKRWTWLFALPVLVGGRALSQAPARHFQKAMVLQVEKSQPLLPYRRRFADSPPPLAQFDYKVTFRMDCLLYDALFETATDYLPSTIAVGKAADISVAKHVIYVRAPGEREIRLETLRRYKTGAACETGRWQ